MFSERDNRKSVTPYTRVKVRKLISNQTNYYDGHNIILVEMNELGIASIINIRTHKYYNL